MHIDLSRFRDTFFDEAADHLAAMEAALLQLEKNPAAGDLLHHIFRGVHSIKGGSGIFELTAVSRFAHGLESLLSQMRDGQELPTPERVDLLLRATDVLRALMSVAQHSTPEPTTAETVLKEIQQAINGQISPAVPPHRSSKEEPLTRILHEYRVTFVPGMQILRQGLDPILLLRNVAALGELLQVQVDLSRLPTLTEIDPECCYLSWSLTLRTEASTIQIHEVFSFALDQSELTITELAQEHAQLDSLARAGTPPAFDTQPEPIEAADLPVHVAGVPSDIEVRGKDTASLANLNQQEFSSLRVATHKIDTLINLVGELTIAQSMVTQLVNDFSLDKIAALQESVVTLGRNTRDLQEQVLAVRMIPVNTIFSRFPRVIRDLAAALDKQVSLQITGEETELDKSVLERIGDPLLHLVRNALDHGIEGPEERRLAGKPEQGTIRFHSAYEQGKVIIEVSDDGNGLNTERVRQKGIALGLISADTSLPEEQIHGLIFHPGFSTAATVSDISGRGVGLDVVKKNLEALNGEVSVLSNPGQGTCFRLKLPLTLAILDGFLLRVGAQTYVLPLWAVIESLRLRTQDLKYLPGCGEVVVVRGESLPVVRLRRLFHLDEQTRSGEQGVGVIIGYEGQQLVLWVDELLGQQQIVIKSLETHYRKISGFVGATILGNGQVALILDVSELIAWSQATPLLKAA